MVCNLFDLLICILIEQMSIQALEDELQKVKNRLSETINCWDNAKSELLRTEKKFEKFRIQHANCSGDAPTTPGTNGIQQGGCNDSVSADGLFLAEKDNFTKSYEEISHRINLWALLFRQLQP